MKQPKNASEFVVSTVTPDEIGKIVDNLSGERLLEWNNLPTTEIVRDVVGAIKKLGYRKPSTIGELTEEQIKGAIERERVYEKYNKAHPLPQPSTANREAVARIIGNPNPPYISSLSTFGSIRERILSAFSSCP